MDTVLSTFDPLNGTLLGLYRLLAQESAIRDVDCVRPPTKEGKAWAHREKGQLIAFNKVKEVPEMAPFYNKVKIRAIKEM